MNGSKGTSFLHQWLLDLPLAKKLWLMVAIVVGITVMGLFSLWFGLGTVAILRDMVAAEGHWSKSQKQAVLSLNQYVIYRHEKDYQNFLYYMEVPLGYKAARLEIEKPHPNYSLIYQILIKVRQNPDNVKDVVRFYRRYHTFLYLKNAIKILIKADALVEQLLREAVELHHLISLNLGSMAEIKPVIDKINDINNHLTNLEDSYSYTLGEASIKLSRILLQVTFGTTLVVGTLGMLISILISGTISQEIKRIQAGSIRVSEGDYGYKVPVKSRDEIGLLAKAFNEMTQSLSRNRTALEERAYMIEKMNKQLIETERMKSEFFANVSHEIRTPLTLLLAPLESLLSREFGSIHKAQAPLLQTIYNNALRLLQMVNGLLDFSKFEAGKIEVKREIVDVVSLSEAILSDFKPLIEHRGLESQFEADGLKRPVMIDRYLYERILFNLLSNAVKFTETGGKISVQLTLDGKWLQLSVSDTGIGIDESEQKFLFEKFKQIDGSSTRRFEGTGLGLALIQEFAGLLEGSVSVRSQKGVGSTFTVDCAAPFSEEAETTIQKPTMQPIPRYPVIPAADLEIETEKEDLPKVLIVEDNEELAIYISTLLRHLYQTKISSNGKEALEVTLQWPPDLILSDIMMPEMDGLTLCREIKSRKETSTIPFVLLTALTHRDAMLRGWEAGTDDYLFKPFHPKELLTRIKTLISAKETQKKIAQMKNDFISFAAHQLKTPVAEIKGYIDNILIGTKEDVQRKPLLKIQEINDRNLRLISHLLDVSKIERNVISPSIQPIDLQEMVRYATRDYLDLIRKKGLTLEIVGGSEKIKVLADTHKAVEAIKNVVENAIKFTEQGTITIELGTDNKLGVIKVRDTGSGIPDKVLAKLFTKELLLEGPRPKGGSGLGLYIAKNFMKAQAGSVSVDSTPGQGSQFTLKLPKYE